MFVKNLRACNFADYNSIWTGDFHLAEDKLSG